MKNSIGGNSLFASSKAESKLFNKSDANGIQETLSKTAESVGVSPEKITLEEGKHKSKFNVSKDLTGNEAQAIKNALLDEFLEKTN